MSKRSNNNSNANSPMVGNNKRMRNDTFSSPQQNTIYHNHNHFIDNNMTITSPGLSVNTKNNKVLNKSANYNDPIHNIIKMDGLCQIIIDTKEFQRLRYQKQLGTCFYVFPGATHTRFEHSIGVSHLSETVMINLYNNQKHLGITKVDILCVKIAGLCHDLGHGPFSHVFDGVFMPKIRPNKKWRHEDGSVYMLEYLLEKNKINITDYGLNEIDFTFIKEIIMGTPEISRLGRPREKFYMYDIVNNSRSGLDVDKLDYFQRDVKYTNTGASDSYERFLEFGRVYNAKQITDPITNKPIQSTIAIAFSQSSYIEDNDNTITENNSDEKHYMICYPEKMVREVVDLFAHRFRLHLNIYTHKTVKKVEYMITDALVAADPYIRIPGSVTSSHRDGNYRMSECVDDPRALSNLNDSILLLIENSTSDDLKPAREIMERIHKRDFYFCAGKSIYEPDSLPDTLSIAEITNKLIEISHDIIINKSNNNTNIDTVIMSQDTNIDSPILHRTNTNNSNCSILSNNNKRLLIEALTENDIIVEKMNIHHGMKRFNPVRNIRFFPKDCHNDYIATEANESTYRTSMPHSFQEMAVRVFCRNKNKEYISRKAFEIFCCNVETQTPFPSQHFSNNNNDTVEENNLTYSDDESTKSFERL